MDFRDLRNIEAYFAEKCSGAGRLTFSAFDGSFMRYSFTVPCTPEMVPEAVKAMVTWQTKGTNSYACTAVFAQRARELNPIYLVWLNGRDMSHEMPENDSMNLNLSNDQQWMRKLPQWLAELEGQMA